MTPKWSEVKPSGEYVYIHYTLDTGLPFYVGKGANRRAFSRNRSEFWKRRALRHGVRVEICQDGMIGDSAFLLEMWLIAKLRHDGYDLCNMTEGGEGKVGLTTCKLAIDNMIKAVGKRIYSSLGEEFPTVAEAGRFMASLGYRADAAKDISCAATGGRKTACGRAWSYKSIPDHPIAFGYESTAMHGRIRKSKRVVMDGYVCFPSIIVAGEYLSDIAGKSISSTHISKACKTGCTALGHRWSYA